MCLHTHSGYSLVCAHRVAEERARVREIARRQLPRDNQRAWNPPAAGRENHRIRKPATVCNAPNKQANFSLLAPLARRDPWWFKQKAVPQGVGAAGTTCPGLAVAAWLPPGTHHPQELPEAKAPPATPPQRKGRALRPPAGPQLGLEARGPAAQGLGIADGRQQGKWQGQTGL